MALAELVAAAPDAAHHTGDQVRGTSGSFKGDLPQEHSLEGNANDSAQLRRLDAAAEAANPGYDIPVLSNYDGGMGCDTRQVFSGVLTDNGQSMYYTPGFEFSPQSVYCAQPQGQYMSSMGSGTTGYCGPQYGTYYQQMSPGLLQYYPAEQEVSKAGAKKLNVKDVAQSASTKPPGFGKPGYQVAPVAPKSIPPDSASQWGLYQTNVNGGFYGPPMGYDCYVPQQWHSSTRGFQPIHPPQNVGMHGSSNPPPPGCGPGRFQNFPRVHSSPNISGRVAKGSSVRSGSAGANWRVKDMSKTQGKGDGSCNGAMSDSCTDLIQKESAVKPRILTRQEDGMILHQPALIAGQQSSSLSRTDYNKEDFQLSFEAAKFFIIKSYSEDDVHKSIKYRVWSSTPNGNKRLDEAYRMAREKSESPSTSCPVFFFFSVNCSGQFCGVAEMVGPVDFCKNVDFWLQGKYNGCLPVKWHIIKDVPNGHFRHIILSNNENKPVTHSRDTQEVHFHEGLEMLKIFKFFPLRTSLLDDFAFYDDRQRVLQERKSRHQFRQQVVKQIEERASDKASFVANGSLELGKEGSRVLDKVMERTNNGAASLANQTSEDVGCLDDESGKPEVDIVIQKMAVMKTDDKADSSTELKAKDEKLQEVPLKEFEVVSEANSCNDTSRAKDPNIKLEVTEGLSTAADQSKPMSNGESVPTSGKEDAARLVINYKKALLEGMQGKVIALDQTIGA